MRQEAIEAWSECLEIDPSNASYNSKLYCNRATAYSKLRKHDAAIQDCTKTIELDPQYTKAYLRRAASLFALGGVENLEACIRDYEHVTEVVDDRDTRDKVCSTSCDASIEQQRTQYSLNTTDSSSKDCIETRKTEGLLRNSRSHTRCDGARNQEGISYSGAKMAPW